MGEARQLCAPAPEIAAVHPPAPVTALGEPAAAGPPGLGARGALPGSPLPTWATAHSGWSPPPQLRPSLPQLLL